MPTELTSIYGTRLLCFGTIGDILRGPCLAAGPLIGATPGSPGAPCDHWSWTNPKRFCRPARPGCRQASPRAWMRWCVGCRCRRPTGQGPQRRGHDDQTLGVPTGCGTAPPIRVEPEGSLAPAGATDRPREAPQGLLSPRDGARRCGRQPRHQQHGLHPGGTGAGPAGKRSGPLTEQRVTG